MALACLERSHVGVSCVDEGKVLIVQLGDRLHGEEGRRAGDRKSVV